MSPLLLAITSYYFIANKKLPLIAEFLIFAQKSLTGKRFTEIFIPTCRRARDREFPRVGIFNTTSCAGQGVS
ncbi:hypothetical protein [Trueperella sp. LYQ141]|uniref:hypothetical protein n=1 Tax=Trueperella sp. LYQ141 TaxID=3391058 RepID=UPI00398306E7